MKKLLILWFLLFIRLLISQTSIPAGWVYGTWEATGSPYLIEGDIFVMGESLNIEPGVVVEFQGHYGLDIGFIGITGQLIAMGTEQDSILFTCSNSSIGWKGLRFYDEQTWCDSSKIKYCKIEYGRATGTGDDSKGGAVFCQDYSKLDLSYSNIINNYTQHDNGGAIYLENSTPYLHHLIIQNNENGGIYSNDQSGVISYSEIINNTEYGISHLQNVR
ncbi:MAG TPA: hypothetical protein PLD62_03435, partial [Candidatus Cloacimonadota bacterium]|nr:hypothetical protein [Candidatus Cloacimonadota bacterium]